MAAPEKQIRVGNACVAIWKGEYEGKPTTSVSVQKNYRTPGEKGEWKNSSYFRLTDIPNLIQALQLVFIELYDKPKDDPLGDEL